MDPATDSPQTSRPQIPWPAIVAAVIGVLLSVALFYGAKEFDRRRIQLEFDNLGDEIGAVLQRRVAVSLQVLQAIANLYAASQSVDAVEFRQFTRTDLEARNGILLLAWVPRVRVADLEEHQRQAVAELKVAPGYRVRRADVPASLASDEFVHPILFAEPAATYADLVGMNLGDNAECSAAMQRAMTEQALCATPPVRLNGAETTQFRSIAFLPVYRKGEPTETPQQRSEALEGHVAAAIRLGEVFDSALAPMRLRGQIVQLIDPALPVGNQVAYTSSADGAKSSLFNPWQHEVSFGGRKLLVRGLPTEAYVAGASRRGPWALLLGGLAFTLLVSAYLHNVWGRAQRVQRLVEHRTAQLSESEQRHRAVIEQASEGIYLVDAESHRVVEANPALANLLGYGIEEIRGRPVDAFVSDTPENVSARIQRVLDSSGPVVGERVYQRKDGSRVDVAVSATVINYLGRRVLCTVVHDITERKRAQKALEDKNAELERAIKSEQAALAELRAAQGQLVQAEKLAGLGQMVAGVAHEINNPLAFVANNVAVLQRDLEALKNLVMLYTSSDPVLRQHDPATMKRIEQLAERIDLNYTLGNLGQLLSHSRDGLRRIQQIVKDLRDFARLDQGELQDADLNAGIQSTVNIIVGRARKRGVEIHLELGQLPPVPCYPAKINQVVMNLLSNAIDACQPGGVVTIWTGNSDSTALIRVSDTGCGMSPEVRERIFDPFFTTKPQGEGTGLGLSISYGIMKDHGGSIEVESEPGKGSTFTLRLPIKPPTT